MREASSNIPAIPFIPIESVFLILPGRVKLLKPPDITPHDIGQKAYGLTCIPRPWVPPFCVISHALADQIEKGQSSCDLAALLKQVPWLAEANNSVELMLRSSAADETIEERGSLLSEQVTFENLSRTISACVSTTRELNKTIHWILQPRIETKLKGHLSNERRVALAKRDWIVDFEIHDTSTDIRAPIRLAIRKWRHGEAKEPAKLDCGSSISIDEVLRNPAQWATEKKTRVHYEWVWDGLHIWLVQADLCITRDGTNPRSLLPEKVLQKSIDGLKYFRLATSKDFDTYRKLANVKLYSKLGYEPPSFYVLEDKSVIGELINGNPSQAVMGDLSNLVSQPLVIRTDGKDLPSEKRQMLPRSDGLNSVEAITRWFSVDFPKELAAIAEWQDQLVFICHHFVPALASAWSMAEPGKRVVRVEALWGIPEGMYWYSHDAFEVDTGEVNLPIAIENQEKFRFSRRERYKEWYIAPDSQGAWLTKRTCEPFDWKTTISDEKSLLEMAITSRKIAEELKYPVNVMWFVGVHPEASKHTILPWFHEESELDRSTLRVAPRFKQENSQSVELHTMSDWEELKARSLTEQKCVKRISVSPRDPNLIRNKQFLDNLATFARDQNAVVELKGGVLSHVFYILQRAGCIVEIVDLFGATEENLVFKKVVRDKIPDAIAQKGEVVTQLKIKGEELIAALKTKLIEEAVEVMDTRSTAETIEELADVLEVVHALSHHLKVSMKSVEDARKKKRQKRGGFDDGKVLVKTTAPTSLSADTMDDDHTQSLFKDHVYIEAGAISLEPEIKLHQDEREVSGVRERLLEIEFPAVLGFPVSRSTEFHIVSSSGFGPVNIPLIGEWSITRKQAELKIRLLIKPLPIQSELPFD